MGEPRLLLVRLCVLICIGVNVEEVVNGVSIVTGLNCEGAKGIAVLIGIGLEQLELLKGTMVLILVTGLIGAALELKLEIEVEEGVKAEGAEGAEGLKV